MVAPTDRLRCFFHALRTTGGVHEDPRKLANSAACTQARDCQLDQEEAGVGVTIRNRHLACNIEYTFILTLLLSPLDTFHVALLFGGKFAFCPASPCQECSSSARLRRFVSLLDCGVFFWQL